MMRRGGTLSISPPTLERTADGAWRVRASVGGSNVFFESTVPLEPSAEAYLGAFLFPAMARGQTLVTTAPVCPQWRLNIGRAAELGTEWWGLGHAEITDGGDKAASPPVEGWASFFTGGVDSFFTLLNAGEPLRDIVYVEGFDVSLDDTERLSQVAEANQAIAKGLGKRLITVRTNLRKSGVFGRLSWNLTHGAALAAVAHMLAGTRGTFLVPSSSPEWATYPLGSHPQMDPAWSSAATHIVHHGATHDRQGKIAVIAGEPLVQRHLRVCWRNRKGRMNCGVCEKCVRTQLQLLAVGGLDAIEVFPPGPLADRIAKVPGVPEDLIPLFYQSRMVDGIAEPDVQAAVKALLRRSPRWQRGQRLRHLVARLIQSLRP